MRIDIRHDYLKELGVQPWYGTAPLPGAPLSPEYEWPDADQVSSPVEPLSHVVPATGSGELSTGSASAKQALGMVEPRVPEIQSETRDAPVGSHSATQEAPRGRSALALLDAGAEGVARFALYAYAMEELTVFDEGAFQEGQFHEQRLLENVCKACGMSSPQQGASQAFHWPVFERDELNTGLEALLEKWLPSLHDQKPKKALCLGANLKQKLEKTDVVEGEETAWFYFPYSLSDMITRGTIKKEFWLFLCENGFVKR